MKTLFKSMALLGLGLLAWTCNEDEFLNTPVQGALSADNLTAREGIDAALISAYSRVDGWANDWGQSGWGMAGSNWLFGSVASDDTHKGSEPADGITMGQIELWQWRPDLPELQGKFVAVYDGIRRANETINLVNGNESLDQATRDRLTGEALFLRGHFHAEGYKMWKNIPFFDENETNFRKPNDQDIFPLIVADLEQAASLLPQTQGEIGRATSGSANAMLGRLHMIERNFSEAKTALDRVENSGVYALQDCYHDIFSTGGENGSGMIFSSQASVNDGSSAGDNGNFSQRLANPHGGSPVGCCGFHQSTQDLVNAYRVDDDGLPLNEDILDTNPTADEPVDPRLDWNVGRDGVPYLNWGTHEASWIRDRAWSSEYSAKKFIQTAEESSNVGWVANQLSPINVPLIRYADVILMLAEIDVENGNLDDAREKVNRIRERAGNCAQGADAIPVAIDDPSTSHATYSVSTYDDSWDDADAAREAVRLERRLELAMEGHRLFDLRRYGQDYYLNTMAEFFQTEQERREFLKEAETPAPRHMLYPIPTTSIQTSLVDGAVTLRQNPGY